MFEEMPSSNSNVQGRGREARCAQGAHSVDGRWQCDGRRDLRGGCGLHIAAEDEGSDLAALGGVVRKQ